MKQELSALLTVLLTGCCHLNPVTEVIPEDWLGYELGLKPPKIHRLGKATISSAPRLDPAFDQPGPETPQVVGRPFELPTRAESHAFRMLRFSTATEYIIEMPVVASARLRHAQPRNAGVEEPGRVPEIQGLTTLQPSLPTVTGEDDRIHINATDSFPLRAIVYITGSSCTGTLIGDSVVLTAAHCVVDGGVRNAPGYTPRWYGGLTVIPGMNRDPDCSPGENDEACRTMPFGEIEVDCAVVPERWLEPKLSSSLSPDYIPYNPEAWIDDIAVLYLAEPIGSETGTFDMAALSVEQLKNAAFLNRGYPAPRRHLPDIEVWQMWGHEGYCSVKGFAVAKNGVYRLLEHDCDTSGGHSGSAIYQWRVSLDRGWRPEIAGVVSHRNQARRVLANDSLVDFALSTTCE